MTPEDIQRKRAARRKLQRRLAKRMHNLELSYAGQYKGHFLYQRWRKEQEAQA